MAAHLDTAMMEGLSRAYVRAVVVRAGCTYRDKFERDIGTDAEICYDDRIEGKPRETGLQLNLQIKATSRESRHSGEHVVMDLEVDQYRKLIAQSPGVRRILIAFDMPSEIERWLHTAHDGLVMRNCAYWRSLEGEPDLANRSTVTVKIPRIQMFNVEAVQEALRRIASRVDAVSEQRRARQKERSSRSLPTVGRRPAP